MVKNQVRDSRIVVDANTRGGWKPILIGKLATAAVDAARTVSLRLQSPELVEEAAALTRQQTDFPRSAHWIPYTIAQGYAGLAVLWGYLDACFPGEEWDLTGRKQMELAVRSAEKAHSPPLGLFSGLSGLAFGAWQLSRQGTRYRHLLAQLDDAICPQANEMAAGLYSRNDGIAIGEFDLISGASGVGAYLLCRRDQPGPAATLNALVRALVYLGDDTNGVPRWHTPQHFLWDEDLKETYPSGNLNCGLAHGVPGPLAFLALSFLNGFVAPGLAETIAKMADFLCANRYDDEWGVNWSNVVPLESSEGGLRAGSARAATEEPSRCAWCYGSPGIARALWLAGQALDRDDYRSLAVASLEDVFRRPVQIRRIDSPTFCHGVAGLLAITLRFANETGSPVFIEAGNTLVQQLLDNYRPESLLGFRNIEHGDHQVDQPGLLDGAPGVALVLLAAATNVEPTWDRLFLLS